MSAESKEEESIGALDQHIARIQTRIDQINKNLHDGLYGEQPSDKDECDVSAMPTASIASLTRRLKELTTSLNFTEDYVKKIHPSSEVGFAVSPSTSPQVNPQVS